MAKFVYCGGSAKIGSNYFYVWQIDPSDMSKVAESVNYGNYIEGIAYGDGLVYCGGYGTNKVWQIDPSDMSKIAESEDCGSRIGALIYGGGFVYCGTSLSAVWQIDPSDMSKVAESEDYDGVLALTYDGGFVYYGGSYQASKVWQIDPSDMSKTTKSIDFKTPIALESGGGFVYCGGDSGPTQRVWQIDPSDMSKVAESEDYGDYIRSIAYGGGFVYCGGDSGFTKRVWQIDPSDMSKVAESEDYGECLFALAYGDGLVYCGGYGTQRVGQIDPSDMSKVAESEDLAVEIAALAYGELPGIDLVIEYLTESGTWQAPKGIIGKLKVECIAAGGAGGSGTARRRGGGGASYAMAEIEVVPEEFYPYTVAPAAQPTGSTGEDGGDTYWDDGTKVKAAGGKGGYTTSTTPGGAVNNCVGDVKYAGGTGSYAGGGSAGSTGAGKNASTTTGGGATEELGGPGANAPTSSRNPGIDGGDFGGGGSGGYGASGSSQPGGKGGPGVIRLTYWIKTGEEGQARGGATSGGRAQGETFSVIPGAVKGGAVSGGRAWGEVLPYKTGQARGGAVSGGRARGMVERFAAARGGATSGGRANWRGTTAGAARGGAAAGGRAQAIIAVKAPEITPYIILDRLSETPLAWLNPELVQATETEDLATGENTLKITYPANGEDAREITEGRKVLTKDIDGVWQLYEIVRPEIRLAETDLIVAECEHESYELATDPIITRAWLNKIPAQALADVLAGTRWEVGTVELVNVVNEALVEDLNPLAALRYISQTWGGVLRFRVEIDEGKITGRYVDLLERRGAYTGQRFELAHNVGDIRVDIDVKDMVTAMYGRGMGDEVDVESGDPEPLTFEDAQWGIADGNPADKPLGQDWVGDEDAREKYGKPGEWLAEKYPYNRGSGGDDWAEGYVGGSDSHVEKRPDCLHLQTYDESGNTWAEIATAGKIDLTNVESIFIDFKLEGEEGKIDGAIIVCEEQSGGGEDVAVEYLNEPGKKTIAFDVSEAAGEYYIYIWISSVEGYYAKLSVFSVKTVEKSNRRHIFGIYDSPEAKTPLTLLQATWTQIQRRNRPRVSIEAKLADLEGITGFDYEKTRLGDTIFVIARRGDIAIRLEATINRITRNRKDPNQTYICLGDEIPVGSQSLQALKDMAVKQDRRRRELDRGRGGQTITIASEDTSKQASYATIIVPAGAKNFEDYLAQAIDMLPEVGGEIVILEGIYVRSGNLTIFRNGIKIRGQGSGTVILLDGDTENDTEGFYIKDRENIEITDLVIDNNLVGDGLNGPWHNGVYFDNVSEFKIARVTVKNCLDGGRSVPQHEGCIHIEDCEMGEIRECVVDGTSAVPVSNVGIYLYDTTGITLSNSRVYGTDTGLDCDTIHGSVISNNIFSGNWTSGIYSTSELFNTTVIGNVCYDNPPEPNPSSASIFIWGENCAVVGNACNDNHEGIIVWGNNNSVTGNTCTNNGQIGIDISGGKNSVQSNKCSGNRYGIYISGSRNYVTNNDLIDNSSGNLADYGTGTVTTPGNRTS